MPPKRPTEPIPSISSPPSTPSRLVSARAAPSFERNGDEKNDEVPPSATTPSPLKRRLQHMTEQRKHQRPAQPRVKGVRFTQCTVDGSRRRGRSPSRLRSPPDHDLPVVESRPESLDAYLLKDIARLWPPLVENA